MKTGPTLSVRFDPALYDSARAFAKQHGIPISKLLREGVAIYIKLAQGKTPLEQRKLRRDEFMMLALEHLMNDQYPAIIETLFQEAGRRAEALDVAA